MKKRTSKSKEQIKTPPPVEMPNEDKILIESLYIRIKNLELKCEVVEELRKENIRLKERADIADESKESMMRLCWQHLETNDKMQRENQELQIGLGDLQRARHEAIEENLKLVKYMEELEARMYEANMRSLATLKQLREMEVERESLKHTILELRERSAVYVPVRDDPIDMYVADYINNYPE